MKVRDAAGVLVLVGGSLACLPAQATDRIWTGAASGAWVWTDASNWGGTAPVNNDALVFSGTNGLDNTNDVPVTNSYNGLTFSSDAGPFKLNGNPIILNAGITNNSSRPQTVNLALQTGPLAVCAVNGGPIFLNGSLASDNGALTKIGPGVLTLNGLNTYPGGTTIRQGTVALPNADGLGAGGGGLVLDGGSLQAGNSLTLSDRAITLGPGGGIFNIDELATLRVTNGISGDGALTKSGAGTLRLTGPVTSTGPLNVNAGTLTVHGTVAGPSSVIVNSGGALGGSGFIASDLLIADGGTLFPGTNNNRLPATLTCSNLVIRPNAIVRFELNVPDVIGGTNDLLVVHGDLTLDGILKASGQGPAGLYPIIKYDGALTDNGMQLGSSVTGTLVVDPTNKLISIAASSFPTAPPVPMRVLFIGNSLTYTYDIPGTVQQLANAAGDSFAYASDLEGGTTLAYHVANQITVPMIDSGNYDIVMLQEYSSVPSNPDDRDNLMYPAARILNSNIVSHGERTMFYETWGYPYGDPGHCGLYDTPPQYRGCDSTAMLIAVRLGYARIADELNAAISPVGLAWLTAQTQRPDINLYYNSIGDYHPGPPGSYLAACVHYASILGRTPVGIPFAGQVADASVAAYLQKVAEQTVFQDPWAYDQFGFTSNRFYWAFPWAAYTNRAYSRLNGVVISGNGGLASPSVRLDVDAGQTNNVYLGVYGYNYESAGQGRLYLRPGGSLTVTNTLVVGKEGQGWVQHGSGNLRVNGLLAIGEQPSSSGSYALADGTLVASQLTIGQGGLGAFTQSGGSSQVIDTLTLAEQPSSSGAYSLTGGNLSATRIQPGQGNAIFTFGGGQLSFAQFGSPTNNLDLSQPSGVLALSNAAAIFGNYTLGDAAILDLVLNNSTNFMAVVSGTATLGGTLVLSYAPGFAPAVGQQFPLVTAAAISGGFGQVLKPDLLASGMVLVVSYTPTSVVAMVTSPVPPGLVGWWPGDGNAEDIAGTHDGTLMGGATASGAGVVGAAFTFDGTNSYVQIPDAPTLNPTNLTIECWVRFNDLDSAGSGDSPPGDQYIVFKQNAQSNSFEGYDLSKIRVAAGDTFRFRVSSAPGETSEIMGATLVRTGVWYHVAAVRGFNFTQLYVNGRIEGQSDASFAQDYGTLPLYFGTSGQPYRDHKLNGALDEVSLYDRALSSDEVAGIYAAGAAGKCRAAAVTVQPQNQTVPAGFSVSFAAKPLGPVFRYQWLFDRTNVLAGATNSALSLTNLQLSQSGDYSVIASNLTSAVVSEPVWLQVTPVLGILMPITVTGELGSSWRIDYVNDLGLTNNWAMLTTVTLSVTSQVYSDSSALSQPRRFYRVVPLP